MSSQERLRLEADTAVYPEDLLVGAVKNGLTHLRPTQPVTLALGRSALNPLDPVHAVFASRSMDVANFCAAVYSRDGWSGWHTYEGEEGGSEMYEFFAAPHVVHAAVLAMRRGIECSVYRVKLKGFQPYEPIPGQFIATGGDVGIEDEYRLNILDMHQTIANAAYLERGKRARPAHTRPGPPRLDIENLPDEVRRPSSPVYDRLTPAEMAREIQSHRETRLSSYTFA